MLTWRGKRRQHAVSLAHKWRLQPGCWFCPRWPHSSFCWHSSCCWHFSCRGGWRQERNALLPGMPWWNTVPSKYGSTSPNQMHLGKIKVPGAAIYNRKSIAIPTTTPCQSREDLVVSELVIVYVRVYRDQFEKERRGQRGVSQSPHNRLTIAHQSGILSMIWKTINPCGCSVRFGVLWGRFFGGGPKKQTCQRQTPIPMRLPWSSCNGLLVSKCGSAMPSS